MQGELLGALNAHDQSIDESPVSPQQLGARIARIKAGTISGKIAKQVFEALWQGEGDVDTIIATRGLQQVSDSATLEAMVSAVLSAHPEQVAQYRAAQGAKRKKLIGFFVGQIMQASQGQANPQRVNALLRSRLTSEDR